MMQVLERLVQTPLAAAVGWALLHSLWQGTLVVLLLGVGFACVSSRPARLRYAIACAALGVMPLVFAITVWWSLPGAHSHALIGIGQSLIPGPLAGPYPRAALPTLPWTSRLPWLAPLWMAGALLLWMRACIAWGAAQRLQRRGVCAAASEWQARLDRIQHQLRFSRPVRLMESCFTEVPVAVGFLRPVILMPIGLLAGLPAEQVEAFVIHELAHIRRCDYLVNLMQSFVEGLLFYHPAVWWISGKVRQERENCCDDIVVAFTQNRAGYAAALTALEEKRWLAADAALAANGGSLVKRIRRLLGHDRPRVGAAPLLALLLIPACFALAAWKSLPAKSIAPQVAVDPALAQALARTTEARRQLEIINLEGVGRRLEQTNRLLAQAPAQAPQPRRASPYELWLQEDVAYIITPQEKTEFLGLQTDQQREHFIAQFWRRRDPTPGTPRNEFQEEHYRRIAYANDHFEFSGAAGWKTDRGRIYIWFGPPDERDVHEKGGVDSDGTSIAAPFEWWRYRFIEGIGSDVNMEFIDRDRTGNYRMTKDPAGPDGGQRFVPPPPPQ